MRFPVRGFMLFPAATVRGYRGVDRHPFVPALTQEVAELDGPVQTVGSCVWPFYPKGWERDAYRLYEENLVSNTGENPGYIK
jgi:hypothetical protein